MLGEARELPNGADLSADVCIVGAGAMGIAAAREFIGTPHRVLVLEAGGPQHSDANQRLYDTANAGLPYEGAQTGRARVFGGTTTWWAGQAGVFDPSDFEVRDWVPGSGWPIGRADLDPYYPRAERVMNLRPATYDAADWPRTGLPAPPAFDPARFRPVFSQFTSTPDFGRRYRDELRAAPNVQVVQGANVTQLVTNAAGTAIERIEFRELGGRTAAARARAIVLCCGAIETARLLLASDVVAPTGVGNGSGLVGRYFQEHLHNKAVVLTPANRRAFLARFASLFDAGRTRYYPKIGTTPAFRRDNRILNVAGTICFETDENSPVESAKLLLKAVRRRDLWPRVPRAARTVLLRPDRVAAAAYHYYVRRQTVGGWGDTIYLGVESECQPNPDSRVTLTDDRDAIGMRRTRIEWRLTEADRRTVEVFVRAAATEFERLGLARADLATLNLGDLPAGLGPRTREANHQMGTTRMSDDPRAGVVNRDCRSHEVANLYVAGAAVFPTGSFSNPTLTGLALTLRLCDHLKKRLETSDLHP